MNKRDFVNAIELCENKVRVAKYENEVLKVVYEEMLDYRPLYERYERECLTQAFQKCRAFFAAQGETISDYCISVPVGLDLKKRQELEQVARENGMKISRCVSSIAAMGLSYYFLKPETEEQILLFDSRDDIMDAGIVNIGEGILEILAVREYKDYGLRSNLNGNEEKKYKFSEAISQMLKDTGIEKRSVKNILISENTSNFRHTITEICKDLTGNPNLKAIEMKNGILRGTALQAAKLNGQGRMEDFLLLDAMPYSIDILLPHHADTMRIIQQDTAIPTKGQEVISFWSENQVKNGLQIFQNAKERQENKLLATLSLDNLKATEAVVTVDIDAKMETTVTLSRMEEVSSVKIN